MKRDTERRGRGRREEDAKGCTVPGSMWAFLCREPHDEWRRGTGLGDSDTWEVGSQGARRLCTCGKRLKTQLFSLELFNATREEEQLPFVSTIFSGRILNTLSTVFLTTGLRGRHICNDTEMGGWRQAGQGLRAGPGTQYS